METIFENQHTRTREFFKEYNKNTSFNSKSIIIYSFFALIAVLGLISIFLSLPIENIRGFYIVLSYVYLMSIITNFIKTKSLSYMREVQSNNGKPLEVKYSLTEDELEFFCISTGTKIIVKLSGLKKVLKTKNYYILFTKNWTFEFKKDSFTKGTPEELEIFLINKGFKI